MKGKSKTLGLRIGSKELGEIVMVGVTNPMEYKNSFPQKTEGQMVCSRGSGFLQMSPWLSVGFGLG